MPDPTVSGFLQQTALSLRSVFPEAEVCLEWPAMSGERGLYSPRLDLAVGPFATGSAQYGPSYDEIVQARTKLFHRIYEKHEANIAHLGGTRSQHSFEHAMSANRNSRCLLALELENRVSRKHLMGGAINAAALGRIGIVIGWDDAKVKALVRLRDYLHFLHVVGKPSFSYSNLMILHRRDLEAVLSLSC